MLQRADSAPRLSRQLRGRRRPYRNHQRDNAAARAFAGAKLWLGLPVQPQTQAEAANLVASCPLYVAAATALLEVGAYALIEQVLQGKTSLIEAGAAVRKRARLVRAYRQADRSDRKALGEIFGVARIFDDAVAPLL